MRFHMRKASQKCSDRSGNRNGFGYISKNCSRADELLLLKVVPHYIVDHLVKVVEKLTTITKKVCVCVCVKEREKI